MEPRAEYSALPLIVEKVGMGDILVLNGGFNGGFDGDLMVI